MQRLALCTQASEHHFRQMYKPEEWSARIGERVTPKQRNHLLGAQVEGLDISLGIRNYPV